MTHGGGQQRRPLGEGPPVSSVQPARPAAPRAREVKASVLAAFQLVEDAHYFGSEIRPRRDRVRLATERAVAARRLARDLRAG